MAPPTYRIPPCAGDSGVTLGKREQKDEEPRLEDGAWRKRHGREKSVEQDRYLTRGAASQKELRSAFRPRHDDPWRSDTRVVSRCRVRVAADGGRLATAGAPKSTNRSGAGRSPALTPRPCTRSAAGCESVTARLRRARPALARKRAGGLRAANGPVPRSRCPRRRVVAQRACGRQARAVARRRGAPGAGGSCAAPAARR